MSPVEPERDTLMDRRVFVAGVVGLTELGVTTRLTSSSFPYFAIEPFILPLDMEGPEGVPLAIEIGGS
jgi:hypothetical protein